MKSKLYYMNECERLEAENDKLKKSHQKLRVNLDANCARLQEENALLAEAVERLSTLAKDAYEEGWIDKYEDIDYNRGIDASYKDSETKKKLKNGSAE